MLNLIPTLKIAQQDPTSNRRLWNIFWSKPSPKQWTLVGKKVWKCLNFPFKLDFSYHSTWGSKGLSRLLSVYFSFFVSFCLNQVLPPTNSIIIVILFCWSTEVLVMIFSFIYLQTYFVGANISNCLKRIWKSCISL